jgi:hypothetical protein
MRQVRQRTAAFPMRQRVQSMAALRGWAMRRLATVTPRREVRAVAACWRPGEARAHRRPINRRPNPAAAGAAPRRPGGPGPEAQVWYRSLPFSLCDAEHDTVVITVPPTWHVVEPPLWSAARRRPPLARRPPSPSRLPRPLHLRRAPAVTTFHEITAVANAKTSTHLLLVGAAIAPVTAAFEKLRMTRNVEVVSERV